MDKSQMIQLSSKPLQKLNVIFDYYHHVKPSTKVGNHIVTGSWIDDTGRYGWDDFVHTNTFDHAYIILQDEYNLFINQQPFTKKILHKTDIVVIMHADNPDYISNAKKISDREIKRLKKYVDHGGSLLVMLNAGTTSRTHEGFEQVQLKKLLDAFGIRWNDDDTHYSDVSLPQSHPYFYDIPTFHYGAGCTLSFLPTASKAEVLLEVCSDSTYTDRNVSGPGIVMVRPGRGKVMVIGDVGSWTGNISRPWVDNSKMFSQLFKYLKPDKQVKAYSYKQGEILDYEVQITGLQAVPVANSITKIELPHYRLYSPRPTTQMPFFERTADLQVKCIDVLPNQSSNIELEIKNLKWFDKADSIIDKQSIILNASRQGKINQTLVQGYDAKWLTPDIHSLFALLPVDGLQPGDFWYSIEPLRIPILRGGDLHPVKEYDTKIQYICDTEINQQKCRLIQSSGEIWLSDIGVTVEDILPDESLHQTYGPSYSYLSPKGGKLLFKKQQWVEYETGLVLKAKSQTRILTWIKDNNKMVPLKNVDKDNETIASIAFIVNFNLKNVQ
ncbi:MAG: hypothetical protein M0Q54_03310 [Pigmentiphaga sp.]|nr:hypothetical protein [Pigmentiphaga sp.]